VQARNDPRGHGVLETEGIPHRHGQLADGRQPIGKASGWKPASLCLENGEVRDGVGGHTARRAPVPISEGDSDLFCAGHDVCVGHDPPIGLPDDATSLAGIGEDGLDRRLDLSDDLRDAAKTPPPSPARPPGFSVRSGATACGSGDCSRRGWRRRRSRRRLSLSSSPVTLRALGNFPFDDEAVILSDPLRR